MPVKIDYKSTRMHGAVSHGDENGWIYHINSGNTYHFVIDAKAFKIVAKMAQDRHQESFTDTNKSTFKETAGLVKKRIAGY